MWTYRQSSGWLWHDAALVGVGYAGSGQGKNNPAFERTHDIGPLPQGWYAIGEPRDTKTHGPYVLPLTPAAETEMYGRGDFLIHGDGKEHPGVASHGCIIMARNVREQVWNSGDHELTVIA